MTFIDLQGHFSCFCLKISVECRLPFQSLIEKRRMRTLSNLWKSFQVLKHFCCLHLKNAACTKSTATAALHLSNYFYCCIRLYRLLYDAECNLLATAKFLVCAGKAKLPPNYSCSTTFWNKSQKHQHKLTIAAYQTYHEVQSYKYKTDSFYKLQAPNY